MYLLFLWSFSVLIEFELPCESESVLLIGTPYPPPEVISFIMATLEMAKSDFQMWKKCHMQILSFFAIWIPSSNVYLLRFDTNLEKNIAGDICEIAKYLSHFGIGYILPFHFFCHDKRNHFWNFVFFFILLHFSHLRCV